MDLVEVLSFLFMLSTMDLGRVRQIQYDCVKQLKKCRSFDARNIRQNP